MRAVRYERFGGPIEVVTLPDPAPQEDGVVVRVRACGICRSDWHGWMGHDADIHLPHVPGHELAGEVAAVGAAVRGWRVGDRVTVPFSMGCGTCPECRAGHAQVCERYYQPGFTGPGALAEYVPLPHAEVNLVRLPDGLDDVAAASLGCRYGTAYRAVIDQGRARDGECMAVIGCGGLGLAAVAIGADRGARVIAVDVSPAALALARELGAASCVNADGLSADDTAAAIREAGGGEVVLSLDTVGHREAVTTAIGSLRPRGRFVQVGVLAAEHADPPVALQRVMFHELELIGSHGVPATRYEAILDRVAAGRLDPRRLVRGTIDLDAVEEVIAGMSTGSPTGIVVALP